MNKPTHVTRSIAAAIDHIITNTVISGIQHRSGIMKNDISDHFPFAFALNICEKSNPKDKVQFIYKCTNREQQIESFKHELSQIEWNNIIKNLDNPNTAISFNIFFEIYDKCFSNVKIKIKLLKTLRLQKALQSALIRSKKFMNDYSTE